MKNKKLSIAWRNIIFIMVSFFMASVAAIPALGANGAAAQSSARKLPYENKESFIVTQGYNSPPTHINKDGYALDFTQNGCDAYGKEILASVPGKVWLVEETGYNGGYGTELLVLDDDNTVSRYAHLVQGSISMNVGDKVKTGAVLGMLGNTGLVIGTACADHPGAHLHFAVYDESADGNFSARNPEPLSGYTGIKNGKWYISDNETQKVDLLGDIGAIMTNTVGSLLGAGGSNAGIANGVPASTGLANSSAGVSVSGTASATVAPAATNLSGKNSGGQTQISAVISSSSGAASDENISSSSVSDSNNGAVSIAGSSSTAQNFPPAGGVSFSLPAPAPVAAAGSPESSSAEKSESMPTSAASSSSSETETSLIEESATSSADAVAENSSTTNIEDGSNGSASSTASGSASSATNESASSTAAFSGNASTTADASSSDDGSVLLASNDSAASADSASSTNSEQASSSQDGSDSLAISEIGDDASTTASSSSSASGASAAATSSVPVFSFAAPAPVAGAGSIATFNSNTFAIDLTWVAPQNASGSSKGIVYSIFDLLSAASSSVANANNPGTVRLLWESTSTEFLYPVFRGAGNYWFGILAVDPDGDKSYATTTAYVPDWFATVQPVDDSDSHWSWYSDNWYDLGTGFNGTLHALTVEGYVGSYVNQYRILTSHLSIEEFLDPDYTQLNRQFIVSDNVPFTDVNAKITIGGLNIPLRPDRYYRLYTFQDCQTKSVILKGTVATGTAMWNMFVYGTGRVEYPYSFYPYISWVIDQ